MERPDKTPEKVSPGPRKWVVVAFVDSLEAIITAAIPILLIYLPVDFPLDEKIVFFCILFFRQFVKNLSVYPLQTTMIGNDLLPSSLSEMFYFRH